MTGKDSDDKDDDVREGFREIAASDPFTRLREFREQHPGDPIPQELEFAARVESFVADDEFSVNGEHEIEEMIDKVLEDEPREGHPPAEWHSQANARMNYLTSRCGMGVRSAARQVAEELVQDRVHVSQGGVVKAYRRHIRRKLFDEFGEAVRDGDEEKGVAALRELERRASLDGNRRKLPKE